MKFDFILHFVSNHSYNIKISFYFYNNLKTFWTEFGLGL